jgi:hypothetical protein
MKYHRIVLPVLALFFATAAGASAQDPEKQTVQESLKQILKRLDDMDKGLSDSFKALREDITKLQMDSLKGQVTAEKVARLEDQVKRLQTEVDDLRKQPPGRQAFSVDPNKTSAAELEEIRARLLAGIDRMERMMRDQQQPRVAFSAPLPARLVLVNTYPETLTFVINNASYAVEPGGQRTIDNFPPGPINYHVVSQWWGMRGASSRTLAPGEVYTITAR